MRSSWRLSVVVTGVLAAVAAASRTGADAGGPVLTLPPATEHAQFQTPAGRAGQEDDGVRMDALRETTDLNVTLIERTPRYDYDAVKNYPDPGDVVTFHGHVINWGSSSLPSVAYRWQIDGSTVETGTMSGMAAGEERVITRTWTWESGAHTVKLTVDPDNLISEASEVNNEIEDRVDAIMAGFWVEQSVYDYFHQYQRYLGIGSNSWQDWIQRQMAKQNELYETAIWPNSPQGVLTRVRIDKIVVVADGALPLSGGLPSNNPSRYDKEVDLMWGFAATLLEGTFYGDHTSTSINNPFYIEQSLIHELGHARYLIDSYGFDVHNTSSHHSVQIWEGDIYVAGSDYMPFIAWGEVLYYNKSGGVMSGPYGFVWSPYEAGALNLIAYDRACCGYGGTNYGGNQNAPANIGVYLQNLPQNNHLRLVDSLGVPRVNADVRVYEAEAGPGWYGKTFDNIYDAQYTTDADGYIHMPRNPFNPGGVITHTYGLADGVMILRVQHIDQIWYRFVEATDFNMQYWEGNTNHAYYTIELEGPNEDSDGDGLRDDWEMEHFGDLSHDGTQDEEPDGLTNLEEFENGTDPLDPDSDDDGLSDGDEVNVHGTEPDNPDTDGDGLPDGQEIIVGTDPLDPDHDDDGMPDGWEVDNGLDPFVNDADDDPDQDGYTNVEEFNGDSDPMKPWSIPIAPAEGTALSFDGVDDFVELGDVAVSGSQLTVETWVYPRVSGSARILEKLEDYGVQLTAENIVRFMTKYGYTWDYLDGQVGIGTDDWVHVACVLDGTNKLIYVNGQPDNFKSYGHDVRVTTNPLIVGADSPSASGGHIDATVDDVRVWSVARSEADIQATMNVTLSGTEPGLVGYWNFDEGAGQVVYDQAGSHDGRLGATTDPDSADPAWVDSPVAPGSGAAEGPEITNVSHPGIGGMNTAATVTATISDAAHGDNGVASATLYHAYAWPFNDFSVTGTGPGGSGDGTWTFVIPAQGSGHHGETLLFFLRADDSIGNPAFDSNDEVLYGIVIGVPGDWDGDGDVDLTDYAALADCLTGPGGGPPGSGCNVLDFDVDADIDVADFASFQAAFADSS
ncbi:MAG: hypothetical protein JSV19_13430 [Phycisphaerales bacterium]|nr:MAG: hypothetical protein JSV19_13430 [Phycisphaerales bacterium]